MKNFPRATEQQPTKRAVYTLLSLFQLTCIITNYDYISKKASLKRQTYNNVISFIYALDDTDKSVTRSLFLVIITHVY